EKDILFLLTKEDVTDLNEGHMQERPEGTALTELQEMIGLSSVKSVIRKAIAGYKLNKLLLEKGIDRGNSSLHMVFTGNPGTAKTTVARLFAEILRDEKVLPAGTFVETGRADLVGDHVGATAKLVKKKFREAQGGVLFIDEAYSLCDGYKNSYGDEAINTIVQEMENHREDVIVIFAGYSKPMEQFLERNPGMRSRIAFHIEFEDYSTEELCSITELMLQKNKLQIAPSAMEKLRKIYDQARKKSDYGNGRFVRKMLEEAQMNLAERILGLDPETLSNEALTTIEEEDITEPVVSSEKGEKSFGFSVA
nr:AAA family ATPase [Lachnospiraceae bacterium]